MERVFNAEFWKVESREITKLHEMLLEAGIPHEFKNAFDGLFDDPELNAKCGKQLCYPESNLETRVLSAITHMGSYGKEHGLIEIMGLLTDEEMEYGSVVGWLTADDVFARIKKHWDNKSENEFAFDKGV